MTRFKGFIAGLLTIVLLALALGAWIALPWFAVLGVAVAVGLWLLLTRSGRLARDADHASEAPQRCGRPAMPILVASRASRPLRVVNSQRAMAAASASTSGHGRTIQAPRPRASSRTVARPEKKRFMGCSS